MHKGLDVTCFCKNGDIQLRQWVRLGVVGTAWRRMGCGRNSQLVLYVLIDVFLRHFGRIINIALKK